MATDDLEKAVRHAELLILGVPTTAMRATTVAAAREWTTRADPGRQPRQGSRAGLAAADDGGDR